MAYRIEEYAKIVEEDIMFKIYKAARHLYGKTVVHINSTYYGGGVAEILSALVPLMNEIGVETGWRQLRGSQDFFNITKKFHNALQGDSLNLTEMKKKIYVQTNVDFSLYTHLSNHNCVIVHDPQPLSMIKFYKKRQPWIWRVHIDVSNPHQELWTFLKHYILRYDSIIFSHNKYKRNDLPVEQRVIHPSIDPLSPKNIEISQKTIDKYLKKFGIPTDKPILCQISRFDKWKDPVGIVEIFKLVKEKIDCRLVLCGSMATDDPESVKVYEQVKKKTNNYTKNGDVILITSESNILVNALQRKAAVILQKSIREGFGLSITEALWKEKPVVASNVGGIPLQIKDAENGYLVDSQDIAGFAERIIDIMKTPKLAQKFGQKGKEVVKEKFLITRSLLDYMTLVSEMLES
ncbi:glycosyl transferase family 1 [candidate division TA06 bacterium DG_78]|uniref:Glycosyl transferase family 1 n=1 Tax=candidate division TA06 bacterium DG_78 TaxID=1703772 RepID=A0A0S7YI15_UNCT6|nr:MAG: glycosyl transferase family 1 [candidate division TA06 bacterium DG_78]